MKPLFVETDPKFHELIDTEAVLEPVSVGHRVTEGIIWWPQNNCLIFSDMAAGKVFKWIRKHSRRQLLNSRVIFPMVTLSIRKAELLHVNMQQALLQEWSQMAVI